MMILLILPLAFRLYGVIHYGSSGDVTERYTYVLTHTRFDSIIYGCLGSILLYLPYNNTYQKIIKNKSLFVIALIVQLICLLVRNDAFRNTIRYSLQGMSFLVLIPAIHHISSYQTLQKWLSNKTLTFIGKLSYSIYLTHMIPIGLLSFIKDNNHPILFYLSVTIATALISLFCYYTIEKPLAKFRVRYRPNENIQTTSSKLKLASNSSV